MTSPANGRREPAIGLTVSEVIDRLRSLDPDSMVVIEGRYGGFDSVKATVAVDIAFNVNGDPDFGPHERAANEGDADARAVALVCRPFREPA